MLVLISVCRGNYNPIEQTHFSTPTAYAHYFFNPKIHQRQIKIFSMPQIPIGTAFLAFSKSVFEYPTIAKNPLPKTMASPEANVVQLQLYTSTNGTETLHWALWAVFPSPSDDASKISAQSLATFLNTHEYLRYSGSPKAGKDVDSIARGDAEYTSIYSAGYPLPTWTRIEVKQGLVHSWQTRVGEDVTHQIPPAAIEFDPNHISKTRLKEGSKLWQKYFINCHWSPHLRKLVDDVRGEASTKVRLVCHISEF